MASIDLYTKQQIDAKIPSTSGASVGDVLTFNGTSTEWAAGGGGSGGVSAHTYASFGALVTDILAHPNGILTHDHSVSGLGLMSFRLDTNAVYFDIDYTVNDGSSGTGVMIGAGSSTIISNSSTATSISINRTTVYATAGGNTVSTYTLSVGISTITYYY